MLWAPLMKASTMVNKPKAIGTFAESATLRVVEQFFPDAQREVQHGSADRGDITRCGDFIFEVKGGKQTRQFGDQQLQDWMLEARTEAENYGVKYGVLVTQRAGYGKERAYRWWVYVDLAAFSELVGGYYFTDQVIPLRLELWDFLQMLADRGHTQHEYDAQSA